MRKLLETFCDVPGHVAGTEPVTISVLSGWWVSCTTGGTGTLSSASRSASISKLDQFPSRSDRQPENGFAVGDERDTFERTSAVDGEGPGYALDRGVERDFLLDVDVTRHRGEFEGLAYPLHALRFDDALDRSRVPFQRAHADVAQLAFSRRAGDGADDRARSPLLRIGPCRPSKKRRTTVELRRSGYERSHPRRQPC